MAVSIVLLRHPPPLVPPGTCYGRLDVAAEPAPMPRLRSATVWSSPASRCRVPAGLLAARHRRRPRLDSRLLELDFGAWEGRAWGSLDRARLDSWARAPLGRGAPGGESGAGLIARVRSFARLLRVRPGRHVVVGHAGPLVILAALLDGRRADLLAPRPPYFVPAAVGDRRVRTRAISSLARYGLRSSA